MQGVALGCCCCRSHLMRRGVNASIWSTPWSYSIPTTRMLPSHFVTNYLYDILYSLLPTPSTRMLPPRIRPVCCARRLMPAAFGTALTNLQYFVAEEMLSSTPTEIPPEWSGLVNLKYLAVEGALISTIPPDWSALSKLTHLRISTTAAGSLTGTIPSQWFSSAPGLFLLQVRCSEAGEASVWHRTAHSAHSAQRRMAPTCTARHRSATHGTARRRSATHRTARHRPVPCGSLQLRCVVG